MLGFATWVGGGLALFVRGIGPDERLRRRAALFAGLAVVVGFALFLVGLAAA